MDGKQAKMATLFVAYIHLMVQENHHELVQFFRLLQAKDVFIKVYIEFLRDRLLKDNPKVEAERQIVELFKKECGD